MNAPLLSHFFELRLPTTKVRLRNVRTIARCFRLRLVPVCCMTMTYKYIKYVLETVSTVYILHTYDQVEITRNFRTVTSDYD
jgi:hypothetical protein